MDSNGSDHFEAALIAGTNVANTSNFLVWYDWLPSKLPSFKAMGFSMVLLSSEAVKTLSEWGQL
ncbi:hypothetical protein [Mariniflexile sp.]|uniref:hypothetical protein n=1 Tax=Mariniflexile sp. TaxID=1979402 RepID=UPI004047733D